MKIKKTISRILAVLMIFAAVPFYALSIGAGDIVEKGTCGENLTWTLDSEGTLTISGTGAMADYIEQYEPVPWNISDIKSVIIEDGITSIGNYAFAGCVNLISVDIPNSVTALGAKTFYNCSSLDHLSLPNSITTIGWSAFEGCTALTEIVIPEKVESIGICAFYGCSSLKSVVIPSSVTFIADNAFSECTELENITLPQSLRWIGGRAFYGCGQLKNVMISESVESIGTEAFSMCQSLEAIDVSENNSHYSSINGVLFSKDKSKLICCPGSTKGKFTVPCESTNGPINIQDGAFNGCKYLTEINIPDDVRWICLEISSNITYPVRAFKGCSSLIKLNVTDNSALYSSIDGVLFSKDKTKLLFCPAGKSGSYSMPNEVTEVADYAFENCALIKSVLISENISILPFTAFFGCTSLTDFHASESDPVHSSANGYLLNKDGNILLRCPPGKNKFNIPSEVTEYGIYSFASLKLLSSAIVTDNITKINSYAFLECTNLKSIILSKETTSIKSDAFLNCDSLTDVYYTGTEEQWKQIQIESGNECLINATIHYNYTPLKGDITGTGEVTLKDSCMIKRIILGVYEPDAIEMFAADMNEDGRVDTRDSFLLKRKLLLAR